MKIFLDNKIPVLSNLDCIDRCLCVCFFLVGFVFLPKQSESMINDASVEQKPIGNHLVLFFFSLSLSWMRTGSSSSPVRRIKNRSLIVLADLSFSSFYVFKKSCFCNLKIIHQTCCCFFLLLHLSHFGYYYFFIFLLNRNNSRPLFS